MQEYKLNESHYEIPDLADGIYDGLLMVGGSLEFEQLLVAYLNGIFPGTMKASKSCGLLPCLLVLFPKKLKIAKSLKLLMKKNIFLYSVDCNFLDVMLQCKTVARHGEHGSWIHGDIIQAFSDLHEKGLAHSLEIWKEGDLVGGLYGLALGKMFCGESMFFKESNASKIALTALCIELIRRKFKFIDCQQDTPHMKSMGAELVELEEFQNLLQQNKKHALIGQSWKQDPRPITSDDLMQFT
ncbi:MAG: leucyl/phenylalanyl-tRNA--protein transferase [Saprospiraceae bacterium]|nr:leucyl/phenylalanyl-tRNA--protein transferase [Saprospiraceae bacterium]